MRSVSKIRIAIAAGLAIAFAGSAAAADKWYPYQVESWNPPFNMDSPREKLDYVPLEKASKPWQICVSFPHMKDAYWLAVDYGVVEEFEGSRCEDAVGRGRRLHRA